VNPIPQIPVITGNIIYCEEDSLYLETTALAGTNYYWMSPSGSIYSDTNFVSYSPLALTDSGAYYFSIIENGCYNDTSFNITIKPKPTATAFSNNPVCASDTIQFYADTVSGGTYFWNGPLGYTSGSQSNLILNSNASMSGIYQLATTLNGCTSDTAQINIQVINLPVIDLGADTAFCIGTSVTFTMPPGYTYIWSDGSTNDSYTAVDSGTVFVTASINGCSTTDDVHLDDFHCLANVPNIITPNDDGTNDYLYFDTEGARAIDVMIYDRWGVIIYHWNDLSGHWDGKDLKDTPVVTGVYFYIANITGYDKKIQEYTGFVEVQK
jgi:gliding motility-associated-like protein